MGKADIVKKLNEHGIYQLRKGESLKDALDHIENSTPRKGYEYKHRDGSLMDRNEIVSASNKEAFSKSVTKPTYISRSGGIEPKDLHDTIDDYRTDSSSDGEITECQYCGKALVVDNAEDAEDGIINCEGCMSYAIWTNCM